MMMSILRSATVFLGLMAGAAHAYPLLRTATPAPNATLQTGPDRLSLTFSEPVDVHASSITVTDDHNGHFETGAAVAIKGNPSGLETTLKTLHPGAYSVAWHVVAAPADKATPRTTAPVAAAANAAAANATAPTIAPTPEKTDGHFRFILAGSTALAAEPATAEPTVPAGTAAKGVKSTASIQVNEIWARATPPGATTGVAYFALRSSQDDKLLSLSSPVSKSVELHQASMQNNVMHMAPMEGGLDLPANQTVSLSPGGYHAMLVDLVQPLQPGQNFTLHLVFQKAAPLDIQIPVQSISGRAMNKPMNMPIRHGATMGKP